MQEINLNMYHAVALGALMFWLGDFLTAKISVLNRFCIPAPLVGGLCFAIVNTIMYALGIVVITFDDTLQTVFMTMFFTTVGYTVSLPALFKGGKSVLLLLGLGLIMILLQNGLGGAVMYLMDENPLYASAVAPSPSSRSRHRRRHRPRSGGGGRPGGYGGQCGRRHLRPGLWLSHGRPTARLLINKHNLKCTLTHGHGTQVPSVDTATDVASEDGDFTSSSPKFIQAFMVIMLAMGIGNQVSTWLTDLCGFSFPGYIGAMLVAVVVRNIMELALHINFPSEEVDTIGNMCLSIFLAMALTGLKLWELVGLACPWWSAYWPRWS